MSLTCSVFIRVSGVFAGMIETIISRQTWILHSKNH
jgi:hypothetical protein